MHRIASLILCFSFAVLSIFTVSCEDPVIPPPTQVILRTDYDRYSFSDSVILSVQNDLEDTIGYVTCWGWFPLQFHTDSGWSFVYGGADICMFELVAPMDTRVYFMPHYGDLATGKYRFQLTYSHARSGRPGAGGSDEEWTVYSNHFWIDDIEFYPTKDQYLNTESIHTLIINPFRDSILLGCNEQWLQHNNDGTWVDVPVTAPCAEEIQDRMLPPGQGISATFPPIGGVESGHYRVRIYYRVIGSGWTYMEKISDTFDISGRVGE